jgi:hypothetical protein
MQPVNSLADYPAIQIELTLVLSAGKKPALAAQALQRSNFSPASDWFVYAGHPG